ncbi:MAG: hypothetical protein M3083_25835 [Actinomycetota bacterium]|nr:hypothetical protein [Actinomycetota bacterium]
MGPVRSSDLPGNVALVTGGANAIGAAVARRRPAAVPMLSSPTSTTRQV